MFPIYGNSGFTYDNVSGIRSEPFWTGLATLVAVGCFAVIALASSGQPVEATVADDGPAIEAPGPIADGPNATSW